MKKRPRSLALWLGLSAATVSVVGCAAILGLDEVDAESPSEGGSEMETSPPEDSGPDRVDGNQEDVAPDVSTDAPCMGLGCCTIAWDFTSLTPPPNVLNSIPTPTAAEGNPTAGAKLSLGSQIQFVLSQLPSSCGSKVVCSFDVKRTASEEGVFAAIPTDDAGAEVRLAFGEAGVTASHPTFEGGTLPYGSGWARFSFRYDGIGILAQTVDASPLVFPGPSAPIFRITWEPVPPFATDPTFDNVLCIRSN